MNFIAHTNVYWREKERKPNNSLVKMCKRIKFEFLFNRNTRVNVMVSIRIISNHYRRVPMKVRPKVSPRDQAKDRI
jgi:hypothetical protein